MHIVPSSKIIEEIEISNDEGWHYVEKKRVHRFIVALLWQ